MLTHFAEVVVREMERERVSWSGMPLGHLLLSRVAASWGNAVGHSIQRCRLPPARLPARPQVFHRQQAKFHQVSSRQAHLIRAMDAFRGGERLPVRSAAGRGRRAATRAPPRRPAAHQTPSVCCAEGVVLLDLSSYVLARAVRQ